MPRRAVLSCPVLSCPVLSCPVLSCPVLSCPVLSCPVLEKALLSEFVMLVAGCSGPSLVMARCPGTRQGCPSLSLCTLAAGWRT
jgi:hypothetical protein